MAGQGLSRPFRNAEKGGGDKEGFRASVSMQSAHSAAESCFARISGEYTALMRRRISASRTQSSESSSDLARPLNTWRTLNAWRGSQGKQNAPHGRGRGCRTDLHFEVFADLERVFRPFCSKCPLQQTARPLRSDSLEIHRSYRLDCAHSLCPSCPSLELALQDATPQQMVTASTHAHPATRVRGSSHATNAAVQVLGRRMCGTLCRACCRWTECATRPVPHAGSAARILRMPSPRPALRAVEERGKREDLPPLTLRKKQKQMTS